MPDPLSLSVRAAAQEIAAGRLSAEALTRACLDRIAAREGLVGAYFLVTALRKNAELEDCLMAGRRNCAPIEAPASGR